MSKAYIKSMLIRLFIFSAIVWGIIGISISLVFNEPSEYKYSDSDWDEFSYSPEYNVTQWNILLDSHSHTFYSDGSLTPRQNLLWHISLGFNAMVLTNHNTFDGISEIITIARQEFNETIKVLIGVEWTTDRCHLNLILPPSTESEDYDELITFKSHTYTPTDQEIQDIISSTHNLGGLVVVNHIPWSLEFCRNHPTRDQFLAWGVDYIEAVNEEIYDMESYQFCLDNNLGVITATDMHEPEPVYSWTTLNVSEFSEEAIFNELKEKRTGFIYDGSASPYDVEHKSNPFYAVVFPIYKIGAMFKEMYSSEKFGSLLASFFIYIYGGFLLMEGLKALTPKIKMKLKRKDEIEKKRKNQK